MGNSSRGSTKPCEETMEINDIVQVSLSLDIQTKHHELIHKFLSHSMYFAADPPKQETSLTKSTMLCMLGAYTQLAKPKTYLEIGTRRGHSVCMVSLCAQEPVRTYCFDLWQDNYANEANPGPNFVLNEFNKTNPNNCTIQFGTGDSKVTIPQFLGPNKFIDMVLVDGDHSDNGALTDLHNVINHIPIGGLLVFDDIACPQTPSLLNVWRSFIVNFKNFEPFENRECNNGWAVAIRRS
jgi:predicted O-methyltransferase YrrM